MKISTPNLEIEDGENDVWLTFVRSRGVRTTLHPLGIPMETQTVSFDKADPDDMDSLDSIRAFLTVVMQEHYMQRKEE